jgi:glycine/serine hydroxymethyltransferase
LPSATAPSESCTRTIAPTRGFREPEMDVIAEMIDTVLTRKDEDRITRVRELTDAFPLYKSV